MKRLLLAGLGAVFLLGLLLASAEIPGHRHEARAAAPRGIHKIRHVVIVMQENRSFDSYFGTFPGADGIPMKDGVPTVCNPDPKTHVCVKPYHDTSDPTRAGRTTRSTQSTTSTTARWTASSARHARGASSRVTTPTTRAAR